MKGPRDDVTVSFTCSRKQATALYMHMAEHLSLESIGHYMNGVSRERARSWLMLGINKCSTALRDVVDWGLPKRPLIQHEAIAAEAIRRAIQKAGMAYWIHDNAHPPLAEGNGHAFQFCMNNNKGPTVTVCVFVSADDNVTDNEGLL